LFTTEITVLDSLMHYTQEQARTVAKISIETFRHWRKVVPYLKDRSGKSARFSFSDLVGLAVTRCIVDLGVKIGDVSGGIEAMFGSLAKISWMTLEDSVVVIDANGGQILRSSRRTSLRGDRPAIVVPCAPIVRSIREAMMPATVEPQRRLPLPPSAVAR
jgi:hypothetical protein